jgi:hypothetical protein
MSNTDIYYFLARWESAPLAFGRPVDVADSMFGKVTNEVHELGKSLAAVLHRN